MLAKRTFALSTAAVACFGLTTVAAPPALADRCEPDELVIRAIPGMGGYESPDDLADPVVCSTMQTVVYDNAACDDTTLMKCLSSLDAQDSVHKSLNRRDIYVNLYFDGNCVRDYDGPVLCPGTIPGQLQRELQNLELPPS